jgi:hypothetical protein
MPPPLPNKRIEPEKRLAAFVKGLSIVYRIDASPFYGDFIPISCGQHRIGFINTLRLNKKAKKSSQYQ